MNRQRRQLLLGIGLLISPLMTSCDRQPPPPPRPVPEVAIVTVQPQRVVFTTELPGRISAHLVSELRPQVDGLIQKRLFMEGADVESGQLLYQIDPAPFQAAYDSAMANIEAAQKATDQARTAIGASMANVVRQKATLAFAKTNRQRFEELFKDKAVSASDRDRAVTEAEVAEATLRSVEAQVESDRAAIAVAEAAIKQAETAAESSRINLGYTNITAPIPGRIGISNVTEGAFVTAYQVVLTTIQQLDPIYVDVPQSTMELNRLKHSQGNDHVNHRGAEQNKVKIIEEDGTPYPLEGTLEFSDVTVDPTTGSVILRIVVPNPEAVLLPGMFVRVVLTEGVDDHAILVPQQAVSRDPKGNPRVFVVDIENKAQLRPIVTDRMIGDQWLVSSGLAQGDRVVVEGVQRLRPGVTVKVVLFEDEYQQGGQPSTPVQPASESN